MQYGVPRYWCGSQSVTRKGIRPASVGIAVLGVSSEGSIRMLGALRLECGLHATVHRQKLADIQMELNEGKAVTNR